jgi:2-desacetyl-2-hydroxyethyl bacteriochlorophyllide A dehydrogenase
MIVDGSIPVDFPRVIGHEVAGTVDAAPAGSGFGPGERVLIDPGITCGICVQCREGRPNICTGGWLIGRDRDGGMTGSIVVPPANLHRVPDAIADGSVPLLQVLATCMHAHRTLPIFPGDTVVVLGLGVTGLLHAQIAKLRGAAPVIGVSRSPEKLAMATRLGADLTIAADGSEVGRLAEIGGADVVIECVGSAGTLATAIRMLRVGGRACCYGTITGDASAFPWYDLYYKEISITNPRSAEPADFPAAIDAVARGAIEIDPIVTHRFPIEAAADAIVAAGDPASLKVVVDL